MSDIIKQDLNFMDKYLWLPVQRNPSKEGVVVVDEEGYKYRAGYKAPVEFDMLVFLYALLKSQQEGYKEEMEFTKYAILKACDYPTDRGQYYDRLEDCLERWMNVTVTFKGTFYDGKEYQFLAFNIVNDAFIDQKTKKVKIYFNRFFLTKVKESNFFRYIHFNYYKALKRPVSRRVFEILPAKLYKRITWEIGLVKLAKKIGLPGDQVKTKEGYQITHYPSHVLRTILPCLKEMNTLSGNKRKLKNLGFNPQEALIVDHELFTSATGEKSIRFIKREIPKDPTEDREVETESIPPRIRALVTPQYINAQWKKALAWLSDLAEFEERRLNEVRGFPKHVVALIFERVKWKYDNRKIKTMGGIYRAFKKCWYLNEIIALLEEKKWEREKGQHTQEARNFVEELDRRTAIEQQEEERRKWEEEEKQRIEAKEKQEKLSKQKEQSARKQRAKHKREVVALIKKHGKKNLLLLGKKIKRIEQGGIVTIDKHKQEGLISFGNVLYGASLKLVSKQPLT